jgi:hypothetical protein
MRAATQASVLDRTLLAEPPVRRQRVHPEQSHGVIEDLRQDDPACRRVAEQLGLDEAYVAGGRHQQVVDGTVGGRELPAYRDEWPKSRFDLGDRQTGGRRVDEVLQPGLVEPPSTPGVSGTRSSSVPRPSGSTRTGEPASTLDDMIPRWVAARRIATEYIL